LAGKRDDTIENELNGTPSGIGVLVARDFGASRMKDAEFLLQFPGQRLFGHLTRLDFASGEFPLQRMRLFRLAAPDEDASLALENRRHHLDHGNIGAHMYSQRRRAAEMKAFASIGGRQASPVPDNASPAAERASPNQRAPHVVSRIHIARETGV